MTVESERPGLWVSISDFPMLSIMDVWVSLFLYEALLSSGPLHLDISAHEFLPTCWLGTS
jgi:hypothetical protein